MPFSLRDLRGRTALVTGAATGIGAALARELAARGARLAIATRANAVALAEVEAQLRASGCEVLSAKVDVAEERDVQAFVREVETRFGGIDILVNNAGVAMTASFEETTVEDWSWIFGVNTWGPIHILRAALPGMRKRQDGAYIVNVASAAAVVPMPNCTAYAASKAALVSISEALRVQLAPSDIHVSTICPGLVNTPIAQASRGRGRAERPEVRARLGALFARYGKSPESVARQILRAMHARRRGVVPVAFSAPLFWLQRLLPAVVPFVIRKQDERVLGTGA